jgi:hypothetical protein
MLRLATMIVAIGIAGFAIFKGSQMAAISWNLWGAMQPNDGSWVHREDHSAVAGGAGAADSEHLAQAIGRAPLSGRNWLSLAGAQMMAGAPRERIITPLVMSAVTAPNTLELMPGRGLLGVTIWEALPPERRAGIAADLVNAAVARVTRLERPQVAAVMAIKPAHVRQEIRRYMLAVEGASDPVMKDLGFPEGTQASAR